MKAYEGKCAPVFSVWLYVTDLPSTQDYKLVLCNHSGIGYP